MEAIICSNLHNTRLSKYGTVLLDEIAIKVCKCTKIWDKKFVIPSDLELFQYFKFSFHNMC